MGIFSSVAIIAAIAIVIAAIAFVALTHHTSTQLTKGQAVQYVLNDVNAYYPNSNSTVISVQNSTHAGSWEITVSILYNATRPCPNLRIEVFDYPAIGLLNTTANTYTSGGANNCTVVGLSDAPNYVISSNAVAIARSYSSGNNAIIDYVNKFGYDNIFVTSKFIPQGQNSTGADNETNVWLIKYSTPKANYSEYSLLDQSGQIIDAYNVSG